MSVRQPKSDEIRVRAPRPDDELRTLYYNRRLVGISVVEAIRRLDSGTKAEGKLPIGIWKPYLLNGEPIDEESERILVQGDVLTVDP